MIAMGGTDKLDREIAAIGDLSRNDLAVRWTKIYGCPPPIGVRRELLAYAAAWHLQAKQLGGHSAKTRKAVREAVARVSKGKVHPGDASASTARQVSSQVGTGTDNLASLPSSGGRQPPSSRAVPRTGARLIREWNGKTNVVDVVEDGFRFEGQSYQSLSAIAQKITKAHWSGPRFFGL